MMMGLLWMSMLMCWRGMEVLQVGLGGDVLGTLEGRYVGEEWEEMCKTTRRFL
jgi:hypothetical protein